MRRLALAGYALVIVVVPFTVAFAPLVLAETAGGRIAGLALAAVLYPLAYLLVCGLLSRPFWSAIKPGRFPRSLAHPVYFGRRLYGLCWTAVYYSPFYWLYFSVPVLKWLTFRLFGYRGQMDFTLYPDTWIRDLPLLDFGKGAYVANKATLGTNLARIDGTILVGRLSIGKGAVVGHLAVVGLGTTLDEHSEVGMGAFVGLRCKLGRESLVQPCCGISHHTTVGVKAIVGAVSAIDTRTEIGDGIVLPFCSIVPRRVRLETQADVARYLSSETVAPPAAAGAGADGEGSDDKDVHANP